MRRDVLRERNRVQKRNAAAGACATSSARDVLRTLRSPGPFTVVAPVNTGFEALGRNVLDFVLNPHNQKA